MVVVLPEDPVTAAEGMLLDLCLHHEEAAHRLSHELDPELVSNTPTGRALNDLLAHCAQGEWEASRELLLENVGDYASPLVTKALNNPELDADLAPDKVEACYRDCYNCLRYHAVGRKIAALEQQARNTDDRDARREIYKQLFDLDRERKQYEKGASSAPPAAEAGPA